MRVAEVKVTRSEHSSAQVLVGAWEIPMLQYEHEPEKVAILGFKKLDGREYPKASQEFERLSQRYGMDVESGASKASLVFGQGVMGINNLNTLIEQERKAEEAEGAELESVDLVQNVVELPPAATPPQPVPAPNAARATLSLPQAKAATA